METGPLEHRAWTTFYIFPFNSDKGQGCVQHQFLLLLQAQVCHLRIPPSIRSLGPHGMPPLERHYQHQNVSVPTFHPSEERYYLLHTYILRGQMSCDPFATWSSGISPPPPLEWNTQKLWYFKWNLPVEPRAWSMRKDGFLILPLAKEEQVHLWQLSLLPSTCGTFQSDNIRTEQRACIAEWVWIIILGSNDTIAIYWTSSIQQGTVWSAFFF